MITYTANIDQLAVSVPQLHEQEPNWSTCSPAQARFVAYALPALALATPAVAGQLDEETMLDAVERCPVAAMEHEHVRSQLTSAQLLACARRYPHDAFRLGIAIQYAEPQTQSTFDQLCRQAPDAAMRYASAAMSPELLAECCQASPTVALQTGAAVDAGLADELARLEPAAGIEFAWEHLSPMVQAECALRCPRLALSRVGPQLPSSVLLYCVRAASLIPA